MSSTCARALPWEPHRTPTLSLSLSSPNCSSASDTSLIETVVTAALGRDPRKPSSQEALAAGMNQATERLNTFGGTMRVDANAGILDWQEQEAVSRPCRSAIAEHCHLRKALPSNALSQSQNIATAFEAKITERGCHVTAIEHVTQDDGFRAPPDVEGKPHNFGQPSGCTFREVESKNLAPPTSRETQQSVVRRTETLSST